MGWISDINPFGAARLLCGKFEFVTTGTCATAMGRATGAVGTCSQLRRLFTGVRARIRSERAVDCPIPATRIGLAIRLVPTSPIPIPMLRRSPLVRTGDLLVPVFTLGAAIAIATDCTGVESGAAAGPVATVSTTPVAV